MLDMHLRMMADSVIRERMLADTAMLRMMRELSSQLPAEAQAQMHEMMLHPAHPAPAKPKIRKPAPTKPHAPPADSMPGMPMSHDSTHH